MKKEITLKKLLFVTMSLLLVTISVFVSCKKSDENNTPTTNTGKLIIFNNPNLANVKDTLQGVYKMPNSNDNFSLYGSFDADGNPDIVKSVVLKRSDTAITYIFDDQNRVNTIFTTINNVKDSNVIFLNYANDTTTLTLMVFNWQSNTHKVKAVVSTKSLTNKIGSQLYGYVPQHTNPVIGSFGGSNLCAISLNTLGFVLLQVTPTPSTSVWQAAADLASAVGTVIGANIVIGACAGTAFGTIATLAGATVAAGPAVAIGAAIGLAAGIRDLRNALNNPTPPTTTTAADNYSQASYTNESEPYVEQSNSTQSQLSGTEIDPDNGQQLGVGSSDSGPINTFTSDCGPQNRAQMRNLVIVMKLNRGTNTIASCKYNATYYFDNGNGPLVGPYLMSQYMQSYTYNPQYDLITVYFINPWISFITDSLTGSITADGRSFMGVMKLNCGYGCATPGNHVAPITSNVYVNLVN